VADAARRARIDLKNKVTPHMPWGRPSAHKR
jgi:hypothetical protein